MPAYELAGQYLVLQLQQEVNSKRTLSIQGLHTTWDALVQTFRIQFIKYIRQLPPFDHHNNKDSPMDYWTRLLDREDASILAYLAIKLFSIVSNSIPEERTVSAFTRINSADRGNQNAGMVVAMTQVLQHERRKSNTHHNPTLTRFRDIPGLVKSTDSLPPVQDIDFESDTDAPEESDDESALNNEVDHENVDTLDVPEEWEIYAGLDEEPEPVFEAGTNVNAERHEYFRVAQHDGIDLNNPLLWDLLGDPQVEDDFSQNFTPTVSENRQAPPYADIHASPTMF
ncbi:hypothetical protein RSAG8_05239, partial [Rhizoctonia solani AG-8 WAC10335]